jgi:ubiquinone/menaquinone biosynthesis C-methylase UbiE
LAKSKSEFLFNTIAPVYGLFYNWQKKRSFVVIEKAKGVLDISCHDSIVDVGCGTGALCAVLSDSGLEVTGVDPAEKMLGIAKRKAGNRSIRFETGNVLDQLPFEDKSFDLAVASYVAHGMGAKERKVMYAEMSRLARHKIIIYDYNQQKSILTTFVEWLEKGDYPNFIKNVENELLQVFHQVDVVQVTRQANWYICTPKVEAK